MSLKYLINLFDYKIYKEKILPHSDIRKMIYGMTVLSNELIKIIILIIFFKLIGHLPLFLFSFCILMSIRTYSGGLHFENSIACFFFSLVFFLLSVVILPKFFLLNFYHGLIIGLSGVLILSLNSPRPSALRPIINKKRRKTFKLLSALSSTICLVILLTLIKSPIFFTCGIWTIFLQAMQLFLGKEEKE